ncbi:MAG: hypothetical protein GYA46_09895 [candidate division Zixibacteria bacterium]|nr:hypothetical protein [candidate division Zixibacteria bacterium]
MRRMVVYITLLLVIDFGAVAGEEFIPSPDSLRVQTELDTLINLFNPLWQNAWPARDWDVLFQAGVDFAGVLPQIAEMKYTSHNGPKFAWYRKHREALEKAIALYRTESGKRDTVQVAALFLRIKAELDSTIMAMQPIPFPAFNHFRRMVDRFVSERGDADDDSCLAPAIDSLQAQVVVLEQSRIPQELNEKSAMIQEECAYFRVLLQRIAGARERGDRTQFRLLTIQLQTRLNNFVRLYLQ